jgi:Flp pilus assembly protein TadD
MKIRLCICAVLVLLLGGCASAPPLTPPATVFNDAAFAPATVATDAHDLFALTPAMRAYIASPAFTAIVRARGARQGLVDALYKKGDLKIEYDATVTRNAGDTFAARAGNCMSLVIMTAALARELNLDVHFQNVLVREQWSRAQGLNVASTHINLGLSKSLSQDMIRNGFEPDAHMLVIDFVPPAEAAQLRNLPLEESEVVSMFMNNRATESLEAGRIDDAYWWARAAVEKTPKQSNALNTLGVIYRRHGDIAFAERSFRAALEREPENTTAMHNLVPVLALQGKEAESKTLAAHLAQVEPYPPFFYFDKGMVALREGDLQTARNMFAREIKRAPYNDEFHFALGLTYLQLGERTAAREQIALALENSTKRDAARTYAAKLEMLRSARFFPN